MSSTQPGVNANRYDVVNARVGGGSGINPTSFTDLVMNAMAAGWEPIGGVAVYVEPFDSSVTLLQAMVRYQG